MTRIIGISGAMYKRDADSPAKLPITILSGTKPTDIEVKTKVDKEFKIDSKFEVERAFIDFFKTIREAGETGNKIAKIVFGFTQNFNYESVISQLNRSNIKPKKLDPSNPGTSFNQLFIHNLPGLITNDTVVIREFDDGSKINNVDHSQLLEHSRNDELNDRLRALKIRLDNHDETALGELKEIAKDEALSFASATRRTYIKLGAEEELYQPSTRFFMVAPRTNDFAAIPKYNFFTWHPEVRETFTQEVCKNLRINHNISLKAPSDIPGRPFEDVAKTYMLDTMAL